VQLLKVAGAGFEPATKTTEKTSLSDMCGAESGAVRADNWGIAPDLARVIGAWPALPADVKHAILELAESVPNVGE
jgi:hypothetical protein